MPTTKIIVKVSEKELKKLIKNVGKLTSLFSFPNMTKAYSTNKAIYE